jgi:hypothetical protein
VGSENAEGHLVFNRTRQRSSILCVLNPPDLTGSVVSPRNPE